MSANDERQRGIFDIRHGRYSELVPVASIAVLLVSVGLAIRWGWMA